MRYLFLFCLIALILFVVLFVKSELNMDVKQLRFCTYKNAKYDRMWRDTGNDFARRWNRDHPDQKVRTLYEPIGGGYIVKLNTDAVAGTLKDVFLVPIGFEQFARSDILLELTPFIEKYGDWDTIREIYPQMIEHHKVDGGIYGLPINLNTDVLFFNRSIFDKAGIAYPDQSWTWNDMRDAAVALTEKNAHGKTIQFGLIWNMYNPADLVKMNGGRVVSEGRDKCVINNKQALEALTFYYDLVHVLKVTPAAGDEETEEGAKRFTNNQAAMMIGGRWFTALLKQYGDVDWAVAPMPISLSGKRISPMTFSTMAISKKTLYPDLAYKFLMYLCQPEQVNKLVRFGDSLPIRYGRAANRAFLNDPTRPAGENEAYMLTLNEYAYTVRDIFPDKVPQEEVRQVMKRYREHLRRGKKSPRQILEEMEDEVNALIREYGTPVKPASPVQLIICLLIAAAVVAGLVLWQKNKQKQATVTAGAVQQSYVGYLFLIPNVIGFLLFVMLPVVFSLVLSFCHWDILSWPPIFVGLGNITNILGDLRDFWQYFFNTLFMMLTIPFALLGSLLLALVLNQKIRGRNAFRALYFLPTFCAGIALIMLWRWLLTPEGGLINMMIAGVGKIFGQSWTGPDWITGDPFVTLFKHFKIGYSKPALMLMNLWATVGGTNMILYLAGLQGISPELYEVASIDGASGWQRFKHITWPLLSPTTFFIVIISVIRGVQGGFQAAFIITNGGPDQATTTISYGIYNNAFQYFKMGKAAALSWVLFSIVFIITLINWRFGGKKVHY